MATKHRNNSEVALAFVLGEEASTVQGSNLRSVWAYRPLNAATPTVYVTHTLYSYTTAIAYRVVVPNPDGSTRAEIWRGFDRYSNTTDRHMSSVLHHARRSGVPVYTMPDMLLYRWSPEHLTVALRKAKQIEDSIIRRGGDARSVRDKLSEAMGIVGATLFAATDNVPDERQPPIELLVEAKRKVSQLKHAHDMRYARHMVTHLESIRAMEA